jgi:site-specific DNA recombinase
MNETGLRFVPIARGSREEPAEQENKKKVAGYIRVSTPMQAETGEGLNTQKELIRKFIEDKGWALHDFYADEGISGSKSENRPKLQQLLHDAKNKCFKAVLISRLSRFGRNARELINNNYILEQSGISLISIKDNIDLSNSTGRAVFTMLAAMAELERDIIKEQMSDSKMILWRENKIFNGKPPFGYEWNDETHKLVVNDDEKEIYEKIVDLYLNHGLSLKDVSIKLMDEGIICKKKPFNSSTLSYIKIANAQRK